MNVELTKLPESRVTLKVELSPDEVNAALDRTYKQLVQRVRIPGFRKGKAPLPIVERAVGREYFLHDATDEAVRWGYRKAVESEGLTPIDEADIDTGDDHAHVQRDEPFHFEATVSVRPTVQLPDLSAIHVEREPVEVKDEDTDQLMQELRERNAMLEPTIRAAEVGDTITANVSAKVDGNEVLSEDALDIKLRDEDKDGPDPRFPGLSKDLVGTNRGDIREVVLPLPEDYADPELAGKSMYLRILAKEIKRTVLPDLDDDFAKSISEFATLNELRDTLRNNLEVERKMEADQKLVNDAVEAVSSKTFVEIPAALIDDEVNRMEDDLRRTFERSGLDYEGYLQMAGKSEADIRAEMRDDAGKNVKSSLILQAVADSEGIDVTGHEVDATLDDLLQGMAQAERRRLRTDTRVRSGIRSRIRRQRAIQRLVEILTGGEEVSQEATEAVAEGAGGAAEDAEETVPLEVGG